MSEEPEGTAPPRRFVDDDTATRPGRCTVTITLTSNEIDVCETVPHPLHVTLQELQCELEQQHPGAHLALAQSGGGEHANDLWMRWAPGGRNLVTLDSCPLRDREDDPGGNNPCLLPAGHVGVHSFEQA